MQTATRLIPAQESSQVRRACRERSYEGIASPANPSAVLRSWPRGSSTRYSPVRSTPVSSEIWIARALIFGIQLLGLAHGATGVVCVLGLDCRDPVDLLNERLRRPAPLPRQVDTGVRSSTPPAFPGIARPF